MIYHRRDNQRKRRKLWTATLIVGTFIVLITLLNIFSPHLLTPVVQAIGIPFFKSENVVSSNIAGVFSYFSSKKGLQSENAALKEQLLVHDAIKIERDNLLQENIMMRELMGKLPDPKQYALGRIISKPSYSPYDTLIIDLGNRDGIKEGDLVLANEATLLGKIADISSYTATVKLFSTSEEKIPVMIGAGALETVATGKGGGNFEVKLPRNAGVLEGDIVTMATYPEKIFGTVTVVQATPADSFEKILFKSPINVGSLKFVIIEKQKTL